jgi:outer membrane biosynthesis protein TonB
MADSARNAFDQATSSITNLYQSILQRSPDQNGLQFWVDSLNKGTATLDDVANAFKNSDEYIVSALKTGQQVTIPSVSDFINRNSNDPKAVQLAAKQYGLDLPAISKALNLSTSETQDYFRAAGVPLGTMLTGSLQRTFGGPSNVRQLDKGEDLVTEQVIGAQDGKLLVQQYDAYGIPTSTRLTTPNPSDAQGWLQALGIVGGAIGASNLLGNLGGAAAVSDAAFIASDAAQLAAQGIPESQIAQILEFSGVDAFIAADAANLAAQNLAPTQIEQLLNQSGDGLRLFDVPPTTPTPTTPEPPPTTPPETPTTPPPEVPPTTPPEVPPTVPPEVPPTVPPETPPVVPPATPPVVPPEVPPVVPPVTPPVIPGTDLNSLFGNLGNTLLSGFKGIAGSLLSGLAGNNQANTIGQLINAGVNYQQAKAAADDLLKSGQISQQQYNALASNIQGQYNNLATQTGKQLGEFTPYGITTNLFGPAGQNIQNAAMQAAQQSFNQAGLTNVDQLSQDYYNKLAALSAPEQQRQRLATEERLRSQGRLGVSGSAYGGTSPELLAMEQAIAQQQLQRELQSRQAALGERGTLLSQGTAALQPAVQLGTTAQQAAQQQFASNLARQNLLTNLQTQGIQSAGVLQRQGLQDLLARQLQATAARSGANQQLTQGLLGGAGGSNALGGVVGSALGNLFNPNAAGNVNSLGFGTGLGYGNQDIGLFI